MNQIVFILSSLNDPHFRRRVEEFIAHGYDVNVYGFKRAGSKLPETSYKPIILGEIKNRNFFSRLLLFYKTIKIISKKCKGNLCFYSSLDIAMFARHLIKSPYIYEVCDLTELVIENNFIRKILVHENRNAIKQSVHTIFTSEGFSEFFKEISSDRYSVLPNRVSANCPKSQTFDRCIAGKDIIKIGFVGVIRFETTYHFVKASVERFKNIEIHLFGIYSEGDPYSDKIKELSDKYKTIVYHGRFKNPDDLPSIYSKIDLVLAAYTPTPGVIYAEPNKFYESLFFKCPIIVNQGTFLGRKVARMSVGYVLDAMNEDKVAEFLSTELTSETYAEKLKACLALPEDYAIENNDEFFKKIEKLA